MRLLTADIRAPLIANGKRQQAVAGTPEEIDFHPVVKLFTPDAAATLLLTKIDPEDHDIAFGLCDLGFGCPELGSVRISELEAIRGRLGLPAERDLAFQAGYPLSVYVRAAQRAGAITLNAQMLADAAADLADERADLASGR